MKLPLAVPAHRSLEELAEEVKRRMVAIASAWNVDHTAADRHSFAGAAVPFRAAHFTGSAAMTWTVAGGSVLTQRTNYIGTLLRYVLELSNTTVGGVVSTNLRVQLPDGKVARGRQDGTFVFVDNGTAGNGWWVITDGSDKVQLFKDGLATNWTASAAATDIAGQFLIEVQ